MLAKPARLSGASKFQGSTCPALLRFGLTGTNHHGQLFYNGFWDRSQVLQIAISLALKYFK